MAPGGGVADQPSAAFASELLHPAGGRCVSAKSRRNPRTHTSWRSRIDMRPRRTRFVNERSGPASGPEVVLSSSGRGAHTPPEESRVDERKEMINGFHRRRSAAAGHHLVGGRYRGRTPHRESVRSPAWPRWQVAAGLRVDVLRWRPPGQCVCGFGVGPFPVPREIRD